jgi:hypothetical protein
MGYAQTVRLKYRVVEQEFIIGHGTYSIGIVKILHGSFHIPHDEVGYTFLKVDDSKVLIKPEGLIVSGKLWPK